MFLQKFMIFVAESRPLQVSDIKDGLSHLLAELAIADTAIDISLTPSLVTFASTGPSSAHLVN